MSKNKLITVVSTLSKDEWKSLRRHVLSKTGRESDNFQLFEYLSKHKSDWPEKWNTSKVHERLFSQIERKTFLNMMSTLYSWTEEWLSIQHILDNTINRKLTLVKEFTKRGLYNLANGHIPDLQKNIEKLKPNNLLYNKYYKELYHVLYFSDNPIKYKRGTDLLSKITNHHIVSSIEDSYVYLTELSNSGQVFNHDYDKDINSIKEIIPDKNLEDNHYLILLYSMITERSIDSFNKLKDLLSQDELNTESQSHTLVTMYLIVYSMKFWHSGELKDTNIVTQLYDYGLRTKVLLRNGKIPEKRFHNIISTIGGLSKNGWSLRFIKEWGDRVQSKDPRQNIKLATAQYHFYKGNYDKIIELVRELKFVSPGQQTRMLGLQLIALFEDKNEYDTFFQFSKLFKRYLKRHIDDLSTHYHKSHGNLIDILERIKKRENPVSIRERFISYEQIIYRAYLQEIIDKK